MRSLETVLAVLSDVENGSFASESIRKHTVRLDAKNRTLVTLIVYSVYRKKQLWEEIIKAYLKIKWTSLERDVQNALLAGTAGILEVKRFASYSMVNATVESVKKRGCRRASGLVNAVLRKIAMDPDAAFHVIDSRNDLDRKALLSGVPIFAAKQWNKDLGRVNTEDLFKLNKMKPYISFRVSPDVSGKRLLKTISSHGYRAWKSPLFPDMLRFSGSAYPPGVPGFYEGLFTPQSESSFMVGSCVEKLYTEGRILDMCAGRGIKTGQILQDRPLAPVEAWEISIPRGKAFKKEMTRIGMQDRVVFRTGNALDLVPTEQPSMILLDVPCSGSGTWRRHPETKWRVDNDKLDDFNSLQTRLLQKAMNILAPGGIVVYSTCSLFSLENEKVIENVLKMYNNFQQLDIPLAGNYVRQAPDFGKYIWPGLPWIDGFYLAALGRIC